MASRSAFLYNPPVKPLRPFELDYPYGAATDETGRLLKTIDGADLTGRFVVGRTMAGGTDQALPPAEFDTIAKTITGRDTQIVSPGSQGLRRDDFGAVIVGNETRYPQAVLLSNKLTPKQIPNVYAHEIGHVIDQAAGEIPLNGVTRQAQQVYNTLNTGAERTRNLMGPQHVGYNEGDVPRELMAEGIRAYMADPNYLKTVAPELARRIRDYVNTDPVLSKIIQFNTAAPVAVGLGAATMAPGQAEAAQPMGRLGNVGQERSGMGKVYDAVTGTLGNIGSGLWGAAKGYAQDVYNTPSKGVADALQLGLQSLGGVGPQAAWMVMDPSEANAGEEDILQARRRKIRDLMMSP